MVVPIRKEDVMVPLYAIIIIFVAIFIVLYVLVRIIFPEKKKEDASGDNDETISSTI